MLIAYRRRLQKIIRVLLRLRLWYALLNVLIEPHRLVEVYRFQVVEVNVLEYLCQLFLLVLGQSRKGFLLGDQAAAEETEISLERYILASIWLSPGLEPLLFLIVVSLPCNTRNKMISRLGLSHARWRGVFP